MYNSQVQPSEHLRRGRSAAIDAMRATKNLLQYHDGILSETSSTDDNIARKVDEFAELFTEARLRQRYRDGIVVLGEERLKERSHELHHETKPVALLDMIDGTDLVNRKLSNWCSALVFFDPRRKKIMASVVGLPSGSFYCACADSPPYVVKVTSRAQDVPPEQLNHEIPIRPSGKTDLDRAAVCFYGQKAENLLSITSKEFGFARFLRKVSRRPTGKRPPWRIYNLGGNPMMCKVADGTMDAVFELVGQKPHDVAPGAFIARCAGAVVKDLEGEPLDVEEALLTPNVGGLRYIIASTEELYQALRSEILPSAPRPSKRRAA